MSTSELIKLEGISSANALALHERWLFAGGETLAVYDTGTDPAHPRLAATMPLSGCRQMAYGKGMLYVTARNQGVWVVDVTNPENPVTVNRVDTLELATGIDVSGDVMFITLRIFGVQAFDIRDARHPVPLTHILTFEAQSCYYEAGLLAVGDWGCGNLTLLDARNPRKLELLSNSKLGGFGDGVFLDGNLAYAATGHHDYHFRGRDDYGHGHGLDIFDIRDRRAPVRLGGVKFPQLFEHGQDYWTVRVVGGNAFVADTYNGVFQVDVNNPRNPAIIDHWQLPVCNHWSGLNEKNIDGPDAAGCIIIGDRTVYIAGVFSGVYALPCAAARRVVRHGATASVPPAGETLNAETGGLLRHPVETPVRRLAANDRMLFAACSYGGVKGFSVAGDALNEVFSLPLNCAYDVAVSGDILWVAEGENLSSWKLNPAGVPSSLGRISARPLEQLQIVNLYRDGTMAAVSGGDGNLRFFDVTDPAAPRFIAEHSAGSILYCDNMCDRDLDGMIAVNWHHRGVRWYDLGAAPFTGQPLAQVETNAWQMSGVIALKEGFLMGDDYTANYWLLPHRGGNPEKCTADAPVAGMPSTDGEIAVFCHRRDGTIGVFDAGDPRHLRALPERSYRVPGGIIDRAVILAGRVFVPAFDLGILYEHL